MTIEVMKLAVDALESVADGAENPMETRAAITALRQAISQPDCRGCEHFFTTDELGEDDDVEGGCYLMGLCTNGDKFQALAPVRLYKVTP